MHTGVNLCLHACVHLFVGALWWLFGVTAFTECSGPRLVNCAEAVKGFGQKSQSVCLLLSPIKDKYDIKDMSCVHTAT